MKRLFLFVLAGGLLAFASADAGTRKSTDRIQIVIRGAENGPWKAYVFGASCTGKLEIHPPADADEPIEIACK